jgi:nucleotide-binding universal stress UspA family protein
MGHAHPNTEVHVLHVDTDFKPGTAAPFDAGDKASVGSRTQNVLDRLEKLCTERIEAARKDGADPRVQRIITHFRLGVPADQLTQLAVDLDCDLVVVGTHGRTGFKRLVLGSVAEKVLRTARCPVYVVRDKDHDELGEAAPEIEPPCPDCVTARSESDGEQVWCKRHAEPRHIRTHTYHHGGAAGDHHPASQRFGSNTGT